MTRRGKLNIAMLAAASMAVCLGLGGCSSQSGAEPAMSDQTAAQVSAAEQAVSESDILADGASSDTAETEGIIHFYLVNNGESLMERLQLVEGWSDSPLTAKGKILAANVGTGMEDINIDVIYSSDRVRASETAGLIRERNKNAENIPIYIRKELREYNYGSFEGHREAELISLQQEGTPETAADVDARMVQVFADITEAAQQSGTEHILVVGHNEALLSAIVKLTGETSEQLPKKLNNSSVTTLVYQAGSYILESADSMEYAEKGAAVREQEEQPVVIYLTRHGKTEFNTRDMIQGWIDSPLTEAGREVATNLGKGVSDVEFSAVYTSGLGRTIETAQLIMAENKTGSELEFRKHEGLREANFGMYEGAIRGELVEEMLEYYGLSSAEELVTEDQSMLEGMFRYTAGRDEYGEAENMPEIRARLKQALNEVVEEVAMEGGGNILIVSHSNSISAILENLGITDAGDIQNASVTKIIWHDGTYTVESVNDMSYAEKGAQK